MSSANSKNLNGQLTAQPLISKTALVVDDNLSNRVIMRAYLEQMGYRVFEAENGKEAVDSFTNMLVKPDVVLMDINLLSGNEMH